MCLETGQEERRLPCGCGLFEFGVLRFEAIAESRGFADAVAELFLVL